MENENSDQQIISVELSGFELEARVKHYENLTKQLFAHIESAISISTTQPGENSFTEQSLPAYKKLVDLYFVYLQKYSKWNEIYNTFCVTQVVDVLGRKTTLFDIIHSRVWFSKLLSVWENGSYQITSKGLAERIAKEPTIDNVFTQQQGLTEIIYQYDKEIFAAKAKTITINVTKQFYTL